MRTLNLLPVLTLVWLSGCGGSCYSPGDILMVQTNPQQPPYSVKVVATNSGGYLVEVCSSREQLDVRSEAVLRQIQDAGDEMHVIYEWNEKQFKSKDPESQARTAELVLGKNRLIYLGMIPAILLALSYVFPYFWFLSIPYVVLACLMATPFVFFSVFFLFMFLSLICWMLCYFCAGYNPIMATVIYLVLMVMMALHQP